MRRRADDTAADPVRAVHRGTGANLRFGAEVPNVSTKRQLCHCFRPCRGSRRRGATPLLRKHGWLNPGGPRVVAHFIFMFPFLGRLAPRFLSLPVWSSLLVLWRPSQWVVRPSSRNRLHFPGVSVPFNLYISPRALAGRPASPRGLFNPPRFSPRFCIPGAPRHGRAGEL